MYHITSLIPRQPRSLVSATVIAIATWLSSSTAAVAQGVPDYMPYQGFVSDAAGAPISGPVNITFKLYEDLLSATPVWEESVANINASAGAFAVNLGETSPNLRDYVYTGQARYIGVSLNGGPELSPRTQLGTLPYAFLSYNAQRLEGYDAAYFVSREDFDTFSATVTGGLSEDEVNALIDARNYLNTDGVNALIDARNYLNTDGVNALIDARNYLNTDGVNALIDARNYLNTDGVNALIDARNYLNEAAVNALIDARNYLNAAGVNALIDARNYLNAAGVNALIDARNYLNAAGVNALIDARNYLDAAGVNALIDARGYLNADAVNTLIDQRDYLSADAINQLITDAVNGVNALINTLQTEVNTLEATVTTLQNNYNTLQQEHNTLQTTTDDLVDDVNTLRGELDALRATVQTLQNQGATSAPVILGPSAHSDDGNFEFEDEQGIRAAGAACQNAYPNDATAHLCSIGEVHSALSVGNYTNNINNVETWFFPNYVKSNGGFTEDNDFCQTMLYNSGHAAVGTSLTIITNATSTSNSTGIRLAFNDNRACNSFLRVLCCR